MLALTKKLSTLLSSGHPDNVSPPFALTQTDSNEPTLPATPTLEGIPPELRLHIYSYLLYDDIREQCHGSGSSWNAAIADGNALRLTSKVYTSSRY